MAETVETPVQTNVVQTFGSVFSPELQAAMNGNTPAATPTETKTPETIASTETKAPDTTEVKTEVKTEEKKETPATTEVKEYKSSFGFGKKKDKTPVADLKIENADQLLETIKTKYGQELKSIEELPKFLESVNKWREGAQKLTETEKLANQYKELFEAQPESIIEAMKLHAAGQDPAEAFKKTKLDYKTSPEKIDKFELVNTYFPGKLSKEDFEGDELSPTIEAIHLAAVDKFNTEKQSIADKRVAATKKASEQLENFKSSVSHSVNSLKGQFPDADLKDVTEIESILSGGPNGVLGEFFNRDGTLKPEAAERLMWMKHGKSEMENYMKAAAIQAKSETNEEIVSRGADKRAPVQRTGANETVPEELQALINTVSKLKNKNAF